MYKILLNSKKRPLKFDLCVKVTAQRKTPVLNQNILVLGTLNVLIIGTQISGIYSHKLYN